MKIKRFTVALLSNTSWSIYNFRLGLIQQLQKAGIHIVVIAPRDAYSDKLEQLGCTFEPISLHQYGTNPFQDIKYLQQVGKLFSKYAINFLITYTIKPNIYANLAARLYGIPGIAVVTGLGHLFTKKSWKTVIARLLYKIALFPNRQVWFLNQEDRQFFINSKIVRTAQTDYLPSEGIDTQFFTPDNRRIPIGTFTFLFAGRLMDEKGVRDFANAARIIKSKYPQAKFEILGFIESDFPHAVSREELQNWEAEGILNYLGETDNMRHHLNRADCVVLPSYYREGVPRILLEAASMELPVITTDNVGCRDIIRHNYNGFLCKKRDIHSLAYWMKQMLHLSPEKRLIMGRRSRNLVVNIFQEELIVNRYLAVLEQYASIVPPLREEALVPVVQLEAK